MKTTPYRQLLAIATMTTVGLITTAPTHAASLTWTVQDTVFEDGSTLTGTFDYDANTNTYSNVNLAVSTGILDGFVYQGSTCSQTPGLERTCLPDRSQTPDQFLIGVFNHNSYPLDSGMKGYLFLSFMQNLTNAGGTVSFASSGELWFIPEGGDTHRPGLRNIVRGQVFASAPSAAVPEPITILGTALAAAGFASARRKSTTVSQSVDEVEF